MRPNSRVVCRLAMGVLLLILPAASPLIGQQTEVPDSVHHRNNCRLAGQVVQTGQPAPKREWARRYIVMCAEEGPAFLAREWRSIPADTPHVDGLQRESARLRDVRLYRQLRETILDRSRPDLVRIGAMLVSMKHVDPHSALWFSDLRPPAGEIRRIPLVGTSSTAGVWNYGSEPLGPVAQPVLELFEGIAAQRDAEDREVWYAAAVLAKLLKTEIQGGRVR